MNINDYMTVQRLLGRLEGLAATVGSKTLKSEICDVVEILDDMIDRYAPADSFPAAEHQNETKWEEALKGFSAIKAFKFPVLGQASGGLAGAEGGENR